MVFSHIFTTMHNVFLFYIDLKAPPRALNTNSSATPKSPNGFKPVAMVASGFGAANIDICTI